MIFASLALATSTFDRNRDYRSRVAIWEDTLAKSPGNERVHNNLGLALAEGQEYDAAIAHYRQALEIDPRFAIAYSNIGIALIQLGQNEEAVVVGQKAVELAPSRPTRIPTLEWL